MIRNTADFQSILERVTNFDFVESLMMDSPNSNWKLFEITNIRYTITFTSFALGANIKLPDYLLTKRSIKTVTIDPITRMPYNDNLCCLVKHR